MPMSNHNPSRKVLFISYLFPPASGGGVQRSSKFVKYLPEFGWTPLVLTVKEPYDFYSDDDLLKDVAGRCKIFRTYSIEPMKWVRKFLKKRSQKKISNDNSNSSANNLKPEFLVKLKTYLLIPDNEIFWLPFAVWKGWRIISNERPLIIYSTASPFTDHLIALILSKITELPWVADFRDLWVDRPNFPKTRWRLFIDRILEKKVIKNANHILTATSLMADHFKKLYGTEKYSYITNGYDEEDFSLITKLNSVDEKFRITYTGIFNKEQNPQKIFLAINELMRKRPEIKSEIRFRFIGQLDNPGEFENINYFKKLGLEMYSDIVGYKPHQYVITEMCQATALLLYIGEYPHNEGILTGKIFEYLRAGRPILAVVPENGLAAKIIKETNSGIIVANDNIDDIKRGISKLFDLYKINELDNMFVRKNIEKYSRKNLTGELSKVFDSVINENK